MADEYTPTMEELGWAWIAYRPGNRPVREVLAELDRALAAHDAEIRRNQALADSVLADRAGRPDIGRAIVIPFAIKSQCTEKGHSGCEQKIIDGEAWTMHHATPSPETEQENTR